MGEYMKIRCLIAKEGNLWVAMSLDFGLAAQASTESGATSKLEEQIKEYVNDAHSTDKLFQEELLKRKGPLSWFALYYVGVIRDLFATHKQHSTHFYKNTNDYISHA